MTSESSEPVAGGNDQSQQQQSAAAGGGGSGGTSMWVSVEPETSAGAMKPARRGDRRRTAAQCVVVASLAAFVVGVFMTTAGFGPVLSSPGRRLLVIVVVLQVRLPPAVFTCSQSDQRGTAKT